MSSPKDVGSRSGITTGGSEVATGGVSVVVVVAGAVVGDGAVVGGDVVVAGSSLEVQAVATSSSAIDIVQRFTTTSGTRIGPRYEILRCAYRTKNVLAYMRTPKWSEIRTNGRLARGVHSPV